MSLLDALVRIYMILLNEFYIDRQRRHPVVITLSVNKSEILYKIYADGYLEPKIYKCKPRSFKDIYEYYDDSFG